jgi:hypothetical protein
MSSSAIMKLGMASIPNVAPVVIRSNAPPAR